jgi:trimethylamine:corrinoid methyltransferase-like protein
MAPMSTRLITRAGRRSCLRVFGGHTDTISFLIEHGADARYPDNNVRVEQLLVAARVEKVVSTSFSFSLRNPKKRGR